MRMGLLVPCLLLSAGASAHHSFAEYDRSAIHELEGELIEVRWRNPHVTFGVRSDAAAGSEEWSLETSAVYVLERAGLTESMFVGGQHVRVAGWFSKRRPRAMNVSNLLLPSGEEVLFYPYSEPRWSKESVGREWVSQSVSDSSDRGIFRIWSVANFGDYLEAARNIDFRLTPSAEAKVPATPAFDLCKPQGMPGTMVTPLPFELIDRGDHIDLQLSTFGVLRRIELAAAGEPESMPLTDLGYSVGRFVGRSLEVRTTRVGWPFLDDTGAPQTSDVEILETFALNEDGNRLRYTQTVDDPGSLVAPTTVSWDLVDIGESSITPVRCE